VGACTLSHSTSFIRESERFVGLSGPLATDRLGIRATVGRRTQPEENAGIQVEPIRWADRVATQARVRCLTMTRHAQKTDGVGTGISFSSSAIDMRSRSLRLVTAAGIDLLRVMISKSVELHFQRHRPPARSVLFSVAPDLVDEWLYFGDQGVELHEVAGQRALRADRFPESGGLGPRDYRPFSRSSNSTRRRCRNLPA
jgi:hypothetical protein